MNNNKLYICTADLQGGDWCVGEVGDAKHWYKLAQEWNDSDGNEANAIYMQKIPLNHEMIEYISGFWDIELVEYYPNNKKHQLLVEHRGY